MRFLTEVNSIVSVGEALATSGHVKAPSIVYLRKALDTVWDVMEDNSIELGAPTATPDEKASTQMRKRKREAHEQNKFGDFLDDEDQDADLDGDEETGKEADQEAAENKSRKFRRETKCLLEEATIWPPTTAGADNDWATRLAIYMRSCGDDVTGTTSKALQKLLLAIWSGSGVDKVVFLAEQARRSAPDAIGREQTDFLTHMLKMPTAAVLSQQIDSIVTHAATARVLNSRMDELSAHSGDWYTVYDQATGVKGHKYGKKNTRDSYRLFVIDQCISEVYYKYEGVTRRGAVESNKDGNKARITFDRALKVGQVLFWLEQAFGAGVFAMLVDTQWEKL